MSRARKSKDSPCETMGMRLPSGFQRIGSPRERALVLAMSGQHQAAAELIMEALMNGHVDLATAVGAQRHLATLAARYFAAAGEVDRAAELQGFLGAVSCEDPGHVRGVGDVSSSPSAPVTRQEMSSPPASPGSDASTHIADSALREVGFPEDDIRRPDTLDRLSGEAAPDLGPERSTSRTTFITRGARLAASGQHLEAAACFLKAGEARKGLELLCCVDLRHPRYDDAARLMVRIIVKHQLGEPALLQFVKPYLQRGPRDEAERALFRRLRARLEAIGAMGDVACITTSPVLHAGMALQSPSPRDSGGKSPEQPAISSVIEEREASAQTSFCKDPRMAATLLTEMPKIAEVSSNLLGIEKAPSGRTSTSVRTSHSVSPVIPYSTPGSLVCDDLAFEQGAIIGGRYSVEAVLGAGGMATVYRAWDEELEESVALKVFRQALGSDEQAPEGLARFRQELKLCRRLSHPNLIRLYDIGVHLRFRYLTMELLLGHPMDALLGEPVDPHLGLDWIRQAARGLAEAHRQGVIHRDIKPENLFVTTEGVLKIMDFGIAKAQRERGVTLLGTTAGTPEYMAPEQINRFSDVGGAADQYSLGVVAYQMFTGTVPFQHPELVPLLMSHVQDQPPPLRTANPSVHPRVEQLVLRLLSKAPVDRFPSCDALVEAVGELLVSLPK